MRISGPTGAEYRVVQLHPTLRCNLHCRHCYSASGPERADILEVEDLNQTLSLLASEGFNALGLSGGEPLLYRGLPEVLQHARDLGMICTMTTNGMLLNAQKVVWLKELVHEVAISLDGLGQDHNTMRGHPRAFEIMNDRVALLREAGIPFGFIFTLTLYNLDQLAAVADFAARQGAALLQIHPLEEYGRAKDQLEHHAPDALELAFAFVEVARLQEQYQGQMQIQFDVVDLDLARQVPDRMFAVEMPEDLDQHSLADLVAPIIVESDGTVVPIQYGFARKFALGNIKGKDLGQGIERWKSKVYAEFLDLCRQVHRRMTGPGFSEYPFANWYGEISEASRNLHRQALRELIGKV